jgi:DNA-binding CsgD family transcriptional regulator
LRSLAVIARDLPVNPHELFALGQAANAVGDYGTAAVFMQAAIDGMRRLRLPDLIIVLVDQSWMAAHTGRPRLAITAAEEARALAHEAGQPLNVIAASLTAALAEALRGNVTAALDLADQEEARLHAGTPHPFLCLVQIARGVALLADGRPDGAYEQLARVFDPADPAYHPYARLSVLAHLAEAGTLAGRAGSLRPIVAECRQVAVAAPLPSLEVALRYASAVLSDDERAEAVFTAGLSAPLDAWPFERARLQLAYGGWLRRQRRQGDARPHLRAAQHAFDALGTVPWGERARRELRATGETVRRSADRTGQLTGQELQIAQLAASGLSNKEIASQLYLSPRTVSTHLYRIYPKVGVRSRSGLAAALRAD